MNRITMTTPGDSFWNSFLLGNGHMGQAVSFHPETGRIILSHHTFFSGEDDWKHAPAEAPEAFRKAREAALSGDWDAVQAQVQRFMGRKGNYGTSLPAGSLCIGQRFPEAWREYSRSLDLINGIAECTFRHGESVQRQTAFCSWPDRLFCLQVTDSGKEGCHACIRLEGEHLHTGALADGLRFTARALESRHSDGSCGVTLAGRLKIEADGGSVEIAEDAVHIRGAVRWRLYLAMDTDFAHPLQEAEIGAVDDAALLARHRADFSARMNRIQLTLPGHEDVCRMTALGRYLLLSGAREDSVLPMSLQGVWNDNVACKIGWTCDMHLDVNTQMNYWLSGTGALAECRMPLFGWMEERLIPHGRRTAKEHYGLSGWAAELVSNAWGWSQPYWHPSLSPCPACGAWEAADYMEHFRYTLDRDFLRLHALPVLSEAAEFFLGYLFEHDGMLMSGPSISPESAFLVHGVKHYASLNCTFETAAIRQLFMDVQEARQALGLPPDERIAAALPRLPRPRVLPDGALAEWQHDHPPADPQHRHMSHMIGLYPYGQITPEETPELAQAARESIRQRLDPYDNWEDTGWARTMLAMYAARLGDGAQAGFHLKEMQRVLTVPNGLVMHPVTRGTGTDSPVWELDGNTGFAAAVLEMLLQSHNGVIRLLPALPPDWQEGSFRGLMARGGICVDASWQQGRLMCATLTAGEAQQTTVTYAGKKIRLALEPGVSVPLIPEDMQEV